MRCFLCGKFSFLSICKDCQHNFLKAEFFKREVEKDFFVYSFYRYDDIKILLNSKYQFFGDRVFKILANNSFKIFAQNFAFDEEIYIIPIDDHTRHYFSHTALLARSLKKSNLKVIYGSLQAQNIVKYAGKSKYFRESNKRDFIYRGMKNIKVILVDDLVTTGSTILEAKKILEKNSCEVLFALTLSDAKI